MKRIIVFRFHDHPMICQNRLKCLKQFNPSVKIYGLFGGIEKDFLKFHRKLMPWLEHCYCIRNKTRDWNWKNGDLALRSWFKDFGNTLSFDMLHLIEWDLLMVNDLETIYKGIPRNALGLTSFLPIQDVASQWVWTSKEPYKSEFDAIITWAKDTYNYNLNPYGAQGPGICIPKRFLELYSSIEIPELCNDEVRIPLLGQIFGFDIYDTHFCNNWFMEQDHQIFHCQTQSYPEVRLSTVRRELAKPSGSRVFHPFRTIMILNRMDYIKRLLIATSRMARSSAKRFLYPTANRFLYTKEGLTSKSYSKNIL